MTVENPDAADVAVVNTCTVTGRSDAKCRQAIRHILDLNPRTTLIVTGCYSQSAAGEIAAIQGVDYILGVQEKLDLFHYFPGPGKTADPQISVSSVQDERVLIPHAAGNYNHTRAMLKIQTGCDHRCTYCIVPSVRGPSRSMSLSEVLNEARQLVKRGFKEIVLTGVHVGEYGKSESEAAGLPRLLKAMLSIESLFRIRLTSLEPENLTDELFETILSSRKICRHFHVSVQSGSPSILDTMGRSSDVKAIQRSIDRLYYYFPNAGLGADIIVGFPGEWDQQFEETRDFLLKNPFSYFHVPISFRYVSSQRQHITYNKFSYSI